ncbi:AAA family ATPase [Streptococcus loxodontisalivarius]|uniref:Adenylate kinase family enzyme n=1 Tax=Streptococcus loxodontisalivarius TaxID=1349415 RepID=A0ABS2PP91_9STRE|nr:AAA family ATPase [Streptococcus loxodontisalivarius]MBM7641852.1 adenylate kinase family enzyme [Streptococcus loxodontisalivarius]
MKLMIIGHSGAGKSTLAQNLSKKLELPCLHLDQIAFKDNWQFRENTAITSDIHTFLEKNDHWVIEGVYSRYCFQERLEAADKIIYLKFNRLTSLFRILKRYAKYHGKVRPSAAANCQEKIDWAFLKFILFDSRNPQRQQMYKQICRDYSSKCIILRSQKEIDQFLKHIE